MNKTSRDALTALQLLAESVRQLYARNVLILRENANSALIPFPADAMTAAQSFTDETGESFIVLGHVEGANLSFRETEALTWLANDAVVFDKFAADPKARQDRQARAIAMLHGERAIARAIYVKALLGGYIRAHDAGVVKRALAQQDVADAPPLAQESAEAFIAGIAQMLPTISNVQEIGGFAKTIVFPTLPVAVAHKKADWEVVNGVALTKDIANQWRAGLARQRAAAQPQG